MKKAIIGKKIGMTQIFDENGKVVPVTVVEAGPCVVVQKKTSDNDGYEAIQVGFEELREKFQDHLDKLEIEITYKKIKNIYAMGDYFALM